MSFKVGDKVVCVVGGPHQGRLRGNLEYPIKGETYTIRAAECSECGLLHFLLDEIINPKRTDSSGHHGEPWFFHKRFRKIDPQTFRNKLTAKLAKKKQVEERIEKPKKEPVDLDV